MSQHILHTVTLEYDVTRNAWCDILRDFKLSAVHTVLDSTLTYSAAAMGVQGLWDVSLCATYLQLRLANTRAN